MATVIRCGVNTREYLKPFKVQGQSNTPRFYAGTGLSFQLTILDGSSAIRDVADIDDLWVSVFANTRTGLAYMEKEISGGALDNTTDATTWNDGTKQHAVVEFTASETELPISSGNTADFFLVVHGHTTDGEPVTFGWTTLTAVKDNVSDESIGGVVQAGTLIPMGAVYDGSGNYTLTGLTSGVYYQWTKGANDSTLVNTPETLSSTGVFSATGTSVTLTGTPSAAITCVVRQEYYPPLPTLDSRFVQASGDTMTGALTFAANIAIQPVNNSGAVFYLGTNVRVAYDGLQVKFADSTWHKMLAVKVGDQYVLDVEQTATTV